MLDLSDWQNKKYTTLDGNPVRILCVDAKDNQPIIGLTMRGEKEVIDNWSLNGKYLLSEVACNSDLINAKTKREGWVNVYDTYGNHTNVGGAFPTKEIADREASDGRIACVRIEWEE